jgi:hypothetical protein
MNAVERTASISKAADSSYRRNRLKNVITFLANLTT